HSSGLGVQRNMHGNDVGTPGQLLQGDTAPGRTIGPFLDMWIGKQNPQPESFGAAGNAPGNPAKAHQPQSGAMQSPYRLGAQKVPFPCADGAIVGGNLSPQRQNKGHGMFRDLVNAISRI